ncbi:uncharacterized protein EI90DRAFT_3145697 [Cantharellus anzutake]|uniref:uncharacterized protein n=1 Tax=Cantharellus anzutake TaxID=1750568 RepID=UPI00190581CB|nr:uncharacterized protein EI90DRAFT_3145697 [Cantharellus anzutake]KAF8330777.1 hypothetical protein EI90DRAFT_3145697 [Cantharellus anzutake]
MVVLAASIVTKSGRPVISRQFREMPRSRIEGLLSSFPRLIPTNSQHTSVETADVRYVYQPLEELYILLITNKASNILQDIDTLHLVTRVVSDHCRNADEKEVSRNAYELLNAFDEVISLGYRENINLMQIRNVLEMESHEEKIQEIISRNKEAEAKEELKRRAKQLELQRREQMKRAQMSGSGAVPGGYSSLGGGLTGYSSLPRFDSPEPTPKASTFTAASSTPKAPAFKGSGMKLGKKPKQAGLIDALADEVATPPEELSAASPEPEAPLQITQIAPPAVTKQKVHINTREQISLTLLQAGGLKSFEIKGDLNLLISDPSVSRVKLSLCSPSELASSLGSKGLQFKYHPNLARGGGSGLEKEIKLKDANRSWPIGTPLGVLRWRAQSKDESLVPLSINCWPSPSGNGTCDVNIEYELENESLELINLVISIPLPEGGYPTVASFTGDWAVDPSTHSLLWTVQRISYNDDSRAGSLEFSVGGEEPSGFFPVKVNFTGLSSLLGITVDGASQLDSGENVEFSQELSLTTDEYVVV